MTYAEIEAAIANIAAKQNAVLNGNADETCRHQTYGQPGPVTWGAVPLTEPRPMTNEEWVISLDSEIERLADALSEARI